MKIEEIAVRITNENHDEVWGWLNKLTEPVYTNRMLVTHLDWFLFLEDGRLNVLPIYNRNINIVSIHTFANVYSTYMNKKGGG